MSYIAMEPQFLTQALTIFGALTILLLLFIGLLALFVVSVVFVSIKHGKFYFPRLLRSAFTYMESATRQICKLMGLKNSDITIFFIHLHNQMNAEDFSKIPMEERAIFLPHCLRSSKCPAELSTEGLGCKHCGGCCGQKPVPVAAACNKHKRHRRSQIIAQPLCRQKQSWQGCASQHGQAHDLAARIKLQICSEQQSGAERLQIDCSSARRGCAAPGRAQLRFKADDEP